MKIYQKILSTGKYLKIMLLTVLACFAVYAIAATVFGYFQDGKTVTSESTLNDQKIIATTTTTNASNAVYGPFITLPFHDVATNIQSNTQTIKSETARENINVEYPQFYGAPELSSLNTAVREQVLARIAQSKKNVDYSNPGCDKGSFCPNAVYLTGRYRVIAIVKNIMSIEYDYVDFTGGGNGNHHEPGAFLYDLKHQKVLNQQDLYCNPTSSGKLFALASQKIMNGKMVFETIDKELVSSAGSGQYRDPSSLEQSAPKIILGATTASLVFPPYSIFSGAYGTISVPISYTALDGILCL